MTDHVPTKETCQKLKESGFPQDSLNFWVLHKSISSRGVGWQIVARDIPFPFDQDGLIEDYCAAPILTEMSFELNRLEIRIMPEEWSRIMNRDNPAERLAQTYLEALTYAPTN